MKYLTLLLVGASVSYGQSFQGTVIDYNTGNPVQIINGSIDQSDITAPIRKNIEAYQRMNAELEASIAAMRQQSELARQTYELEEQTRLLRKIAEKE